MFIFKKPDFFTRDVFSTFSYSVGFSSIFFHCFFGIFSFSLEKNSAALFLSSFLQDYNLLQEGVDR